MKKTIRLSVIWILLSMFSATALNAQTYPDYALEWIYPQTLSSLVRCYTPTKAVSLYRNYHFISDYPYYVDYSTINVVDISGNIHSIDMLSDYVVYDMEIVNDYLIMCGQYNYAKAFIACVDIQAIIGGTASVKYHTADNISIFRKMAAYQDLTGDIKVEVVGAIDYMDDNPVLMAGCSLSWTYTPCGGMYSCEQNLVMECVNPQNSTLGSNDIRYVNNDSHAEVIDDVVLTDNYVVFIGQEIISGKKNLTVHPCDRNNVLPDFDYYHYFPVGDEGYTYYIGCHMKDDTIALASRGRYLKPGWSEHDVRVRTIDIPSMTMTTSQAFDLNGYKSDPQDMVYMPENNRLVLLEDIVYPAGIGVNNYSFLFLEPYNTFTSGGTPVIAPPTPTLTPYMANGLFESTRGLTFWSLDKVIGSNRFVATGGDYWMLKSVPFIDPTQTCYKPVSVEVHKIDDIIELPNNFIYDACQETFISNDIPTATYTPILSVSCYLP